MYLVIIAKINCHSNKMKVVMGRTYRIRLLTKEGTRPDEYEGFKGGEGLNL